MTFVSIVNGGKCLIGIVVLMTIVKYSFQVTWCWQRCVFSHGSLLYEKHLFKQRIGFGFQ